MTLSEFVSEELFCCIVNVDNVDFDIMWLQDNDVMWYKWKMQLMIYKTDGILIEKNEGF